MLKSYLIILTLLIFFIDLTAQSLDIPSSRRGISFGNSTNFTGLRFNYRDQDVEEITGINVTLWKGDENKYSIVRGISVGILGAGSGGDISGIGLGVGSPTIKGITIGGLAVGGVDVTGITAAIGMIKIENNGTHTGFNLSVFNYIRGTRVGFSIGIVNYAYNLKGIQIGLVNYVRDNPKYLKVLPIINANF